MEKILEISECGFTGNDSWDSYEGWLITTTEQTIKIGIADGQDCCEHWGYFLSEDDVEDFIGASLLSVSIVDTCLKLTKLKEEWVSEDSAMFINFETSEGTLQFTVYNEHNGYYGHSVVVESKQLTEHTCL